MNLDLDFGLYSINLNRIINYLKQDMSDDWFQDPLFFSDRLKQDCIIDYFEKNINQNSGAYLPNDRILLNIPKPEGTLRYSLETNFFDRFAFHAYGVTIIQHFDKMISKRVFSHRLNNRDFDKSNAKYLFYNPIIQWKKFEEYIKIDSLNSCILISDLQNYYENINIDILRGTLYLLLKKCDASGKEKAKIRFCIDSICSCLLKWTFNEEHGLPQNRDISSFLANVYMYPIDEEMINQGFDYYRYMDDIRIICKDQYEARKALKILSCELREIGLTINGKKTSILINGTDEHKEFIEDNGVELESLDALLNTKKKQIVAIAFQQIKEEFEKCLEQKDYTSKKFRFLLNRISKIALCKDIKKPNTYFNFIKGNIIGAIVTTPSSMYDFFHILSCIDLTNGDMNKIYKYLSDEEKAIYSWQNYLLWKLLVMKNYRNRNLLIFARKQVKSLKTANVAGALLYIGKYGNIHDKKDLLTIFNGKKCFFVQRHFLIAVQELERKEIQKIEMEILEENRGVYKYLHELRAPLYMSLPNEIKYSDIFNQVGFYV
ncbi:hypothetical protein FACS1894137_17130 [Spirochaetia bacterium]|nr:hypothetical protein FACS1894137_17130 [Spirochaetia bacterium]